MPNCSHASYIPGCLTEVTVNPSGEAFPTNHYQMMPPKTGSPSKMAHNMAGNNPYKQELEDTINSKVRHKNLA